MLEVEPAGQCGHKATRYDQIVLVTEKFTVDRHYLKNHKVG